MEYMPKKASTALAVGVALAPDGSGAVQPAVAATTRVIGINQVLVASTDSDYASNTLIGYILPQADNEFDVDFDGTYTAALIGTNVDIDATGLKANLSGTSHNQLTVLGLGSTSTLVRVKINGAYSFENAV